MIANYSHAGLKTVWDGIDIMITFDSNSNKATSIAKEVAKKYSKGYTDITRKQLNKLRSSYHLKNTNVEPRVFAFIESYGVRVSVWYLTNAFATLTLRSTISLEILSKEEDIEFILVPVGGGGLISGIAYTIKNIDPAIEVIGVQSETSPVMYESLKQGKIIKIETKPSIAEGLHGLIEENSITFDYVSRYVDDIILVSEEDIEKEIVELIRQHRLIAEGAGVVGLAALKKYRNRFRGRKGIVIISGGNIDFNVIKRLVSNY